MEMKATITERLTGGHASRLRRFLPWIGHLARIGLGLVFLVAGILKMVDPAEFAHQMAGYAIVGPGTAAIAAPLLIALETALGVALLAGYRTTISAPIAVGLLTAFIGVEAYGMATGRTEACGCFGAFVERTPGQVIVEDLVFLGMALLAWLLLREWRQRRSRLVVGSVIGTAFASLALAVASPHLPIDPYVTRLSVGRSVGDLGIPADLPSMLSGKHLVALFDVTAPDAHDLSERLSAIATRDDGPGLVALTPSSGEETTAFFWSAVPDFDIHSVDRVVLKRLYRRLPLFFTVESGRVAGVYDDAGRAAADLISSQGL